MRRNGTSPDAAIASIAARQFGHFSRAQALEVGFTSKAIRVRLDTGRWQRALPAVYVIAGVPPSWEQNVMATILVAGPIAVASHVTAAALFGLIERRRWKIHVTVPNPSHHGRYPGRVIHRAISLGPADVDMAAGIPVTCAARTLVDLSGSVQPSVLEAAIDEALRGRLVTAQAVTGYIRQRKLEHLRGVGRLTTVLADRHRGVPESELERAFLRLIHRAELPEPERQHRVGRRRVDFAYPEAGIVIELDGHRFHATEQQLRADDERQNEIVLSGRVPLRFTWYDVTKRPSQVVATLRQALAGRVKAP